MFNPNKIKEVREAAGMSQTDLGQALGVHKNTVLRWEKGERPININEFLSLCETTGVSPIMMLDQPTMAAETLVAYQIDPPFDPSRMRAVIELAEEELAGLDAEDRPTPAQVATLILKFYEIEAAIGTPVLQMRDRILPFIQALRVG